MEKLVGIRMPGGGILALIRGVRSVLGKWRGNRMPRLHNMEKGRVRGKFIHTISDEFIK